jgi:hypothetical protein
MFLKSIASFRKFAKFGLIAFVMPLFLFAGQAPVVNSESVLEPLNLCSGANCRGKDPVAAGCSKTAVTLAVRTGGGVRIELRYSARCRAKWARVTNLAGNQRPWTQASLSPWQDSVNVIQRKSVVWSGMWSGAGIAACGAPSPDSQLTPQPLCTAFK